MAVYLKIRLAQSNGEVPDGWTTINVRNIRHFHPKVGGPYAGLAVVHMVDLGAPFVVLTKYEKFLEAATDPKIYIDLSGL